MNTAIHENGQTNELDEKQTNWMKNELYFFSSESQKVANMGMCKQTIWMKNKPTN